MITIRIQASTLATALRLSLCVVLAAAAFGAGSASAWILDLPDVCEAAGPDVTLGDVATGEIPAEASALVLMGRCDPGRTYTFTRRRLLRELSTRQMAADVVFRGAVTCRVTVTGNTVGRSELEAALLAGLSRWLPEEVPGAPAAALAIESELPSVAVDGAWTLELVEPRPLRPGRNLVAVHVTAPRGGTRFTATVVCHAFGEIPRARTTIREGDPLQEELFTWEWRNLAQLDAGVAVGRHVLSGMTAVRTLSLGDELRDADMKRTPLVRQGEPVELVFGRGGVEVTLRATARQDGAEGQVVTVRNEIDGRLITGRVTGPGRVSWRK